MSLVRRETEWMRRGPPARSTKAKARIDRYHALLDDAPDAPLGELDFSIPPGPRVFVVRREPSLYRPYENWCTKCTNGGRFVV